MKQNLDLWDPRPTKCRTEKKSFISVFCSWNRAVCSCYLFLFLYFCFCFSWKRAACSCYLWCSFGKVRVRRQKQSKSSRECFSAKYLQKWKYPNCLKMKYSSSNNTKNQKVWNLSIFQFLVLSLCTAAGHFQESI